MPETIDPRYPSVEHLVARARQRVPGFAFDYLAGGCFSEVNLARNRADVRQVQLRPFYLRRYDGADLGVDLLGERFAAPFGVAPIGLQGLMWPRACEILAEAAARHDVLFVLSTVSTATIERVAEITAGRAWFQLYHPREDSLRDALLARAHAAGIRTLVALADTPTFGYRPKEIRNGLSIPPRMTARNIAQMLLHPTWSLAQLRAGAPRFATMQDYIPRGLSMKHLGEFMNQTFAGRLTIDKLRALRERWQGKLVVKGVVSAEDAEAALDVGVDGLIVSNHGGRQLDNGQSTIRSLAELADAGFGARTTLMVDGGFHAGTDIAGALACGARFVFVGRAPMFGVCALGRRGGDHVLSMLQRQLRQVLEQLACARVADLPGHLIESSIRDWRQP